MTTDRTLDSERPPLAADPISGALGELIAHAQAMLVDPKSAVAAEELTACITQCEQILESASRPPDSDVWHYLNRAQIAQWLGVRPATLARVRLPRPDVTVGPVNPDGTLPKGTVRGWSPRTVQRWAALRPGRRRDR